MAIPDDKIVESLHHLLQVCKDGQDGFQYAAGAITNPELKALFMAFAEQRSRFVSELLSAIHQIDSVAKVAGDTPLLYRCWMGIQTAVLEGDEAIIAESERGEDCTYKAYEAVLSLDLPIAVRSVVKAQYSHIQLSHNRIRELTLAQA